MIVAGITAGLTIILFAALILQEILDDRHRLGLTADEATAFAPIVAGESAILMLLLCIHYLVALAILSIFGIYFAGLIVFSVIKYNGYLIGLSPAAKKVFGWFIGIFTAILLFLMAGKF